METPRQAGLPLIAVDIGNARAKLGRFDPAGAGGPSCSPLTPHAQGKSQLPWPADTLSLDARQPAFEQLALWLRLAGRPAFSWWIGSVNRPATTVLLDWLRKERPQDGVTLLGSADLPLAVHLPEPDKVGVDRLLDAVAANVLREPGQPAVVVDVGTAITVDLVSADGAFCGGAILPGIAMSARALKEFTDLLPHVDVADLHEPPTPVGKSTVDAMRSGLFWYAVGAVRELATRMTAADEMAADPSESPSATLLITGGAGEAVAKLLGPRARLVPHLTLAGIALTTRADTARWSQETPPDRSVS
ncbi:MAG: type III pantothenate kinase [Patescibacteria group bacterium]|nr:type III pantothenate kinase [Patescibacteria group bacterium]